MPSGSRPRSRGAVTEPGPTGKRARTDKLSISLPTDDVEWLTKRAKRLGTSVSAVVAGALTEQRRREAGQRLLGLLGDDDITEDDVAALRREAFGR